MMIVIQEATRSHPRTIKYLLKFKNVNPAGHNNKAIITASSNGNTKTVKLLMKDKRIDPSARKNKAITSAADAGFPEIVKLLLTDRRIKVSNQGLINAMDNNNLRTMKILLSDDTRDYTKILANVKPSRTPTEDMNHLISDFLKGSITKQSLRREEEIYTKMIHYWSDKLGKQNQMIGYFYHGRETENIIKFLKKNKLLEVDNFGVGIKVKLLEGNIQTFIDRYFLNIRAYLEVYPNWIRIIFQPEPKSNVFIITIGDNTNSEKL